MKISFAAVISATMIGLLGSPPAIAQSPANQFPTELAAQEYCKTARVVWVNLNNKRYYSNRATQYGRTKNGAYMCAKEARAAGFRRSLNERASAF